MKNNIIKSILVPLDFSKASLNALDTAIAIATQQNSSIRLLNVAAPNLMFGFKGGHYISEKTIDGIVDVSARMLNSLLTALNEKHHLNFTSEVKVGLVPQSITYPAAEIDADLIIMGTRGVSGFREFFMGSTAQKVVKISACPVLTIPPCKKWLDFKKILFPVRPIKGVMEKYDFLRKIIANTNASMDVLFLVPAYDEIEKKLLKNLVKDIKVKVINDQVKVSGTLKIGEKISQAVLKRSKSIDADLIVITAKTDADFKQCFIDPFEQQIVNHATMPVLSIRPKLTSPDSQVVVQKI
jgi:nucleotide-binding universal stress UspA family protein